MAAKKKAPAFYELKAVAEFLRSLDVNREMDTTIRVSGVVLQDAWDDEPKELGRIRYDVGRGEHVFTPAEG